MSKKFRIALFLCSAAAFLLSTASMAQDDEVITPEGFGADETPPPEVESGTEPDAVPAPPEPTAPAVARLSEEDKTAIERAAKEAAKEAAKQAVEEKMKEMEAPDKEKGGKAAPKSDFMDTRITWVFGDDDFLSDAGDKIPDSPLLSIGDREGYELFMDNIDSRYSGRENLTHLVMYKKFPGFFPKLTTEAALVLKFQLSETDVDMTDDGTYIRLHYHTSGTDSPNGVSVVLFPFDTERFRLGYLWDISWGGGSLFTNKRNGWAPGAKLALRFDRFDAFVGFKTAKISQLQETGPEGQPLSVQETNFGFLGGLGYDIKDVFKIDAGFGYFQQGTFEFAGVLGKPVYSFGGSMRLTFHWGMDVGLPADFALYRNQPDAEELIAKPEPYKKGKLGIVVSLEGVGLAQHLADPEDFGSTELQPAFAAAGQIKIKYGNTRIHLTTFFRTLEFILHNVPSFTPFMAIPGSVDLQHEVFVAVGADHYFAKPHLTPGIIAGFQFPAAYTSGGSTIVVRSEELRDILVSGDKAKPIFTGRVSLRLDLSEIISLITFVQYVHDVNRTRLRRDEYGTYRVYTAENEIGAAIVMQARF
jgi:hypothetical protein